MKKSALLVLLLALAGISAHAQQALWGGPQVDSPVINEDGTVTFRFQAPKAVKVEVRDDAKGYPYKYMETEGGHIWRNWRIYLTEFVPLLFK